MALPQTPPQKKIILYFGVCKMEQRSEVLIKQSPFNMHNSISGSGIHGGSDSVQYVGVFDSVW